MQADEVIDVPLYLQIATRVKHHIAAGELREGDRLPSLRAGAERWGVNLHTVRRAYALLEEDGLVHTRARSATRVTASAAALPSHEDGLAAFLESVARIATARFGVGAEELARRLAQASRPPATPLWVLECSDSLAQSLAAQIAAWSGLDVRPWVLREGGPLPNGRHLSTYYHFAQVHRLLADRASQAAFFGVRIEPHNLLGLSAAARRAGQLMILAVDAASGGALAAEVGRELDDDVAVELRVTQQPRSVLRELLPHVPVLVTPQNWDRLTATDRRDPRLFPLTLEPDERDLRRIADSFGWPVGDAPPGGRRVAAAHDRDPGRTVDERVC